jgi:hypothetical protein
VRHEVLLVHVRNTRERGRKKDKGNVRKKEENESGRRIRERSGRRMMG